MLGYCVSGLFSIYGKNHYSSLFSKCVIQCICKCPDACCAALVCGSIIKMDLALSFYPLEPAETPKYVIIKIGP